jgi:hypothetical protein
MTDTVLNEDWEFGKSKPYLSAELVIDGLGENLLANLVASSS